MSGTLQASVIKDEASATNNLTLNTSGGVTVGQNLTVTGTTTLTGTVGATTFSGAVTAASFIPTGSSVPANGMYLSAANTLNFSTNTTNQLAISSSGIVTGTAGNLMLVQGTNVPTTSGTTATFTGIPSWAKRITVMFAGVSTNGTSNFLVQLVTGGGTISSGYNSGCTGGTVGVASTTATNGFLATSTINASTDLQGGIMTISNVTSNIWCYSSIINTGTAGRFQAGGGNVNAGAAVTGIIVTTVSANIFATGNINIQYE